MLKEFTMFTSSLEGVLWEGSMRVCIKQIQVQFKKSEEIGGQAKCLLLSSQSGIFEISKCLKRPLWF